MKQRIKLYKEECRHYLKDWVLESPDSGNIAACASCLEELFVIPKSCEELTLIVSNRRFKESYEVIITKSGYYMVEGIKHSSYALMALREEISESLINSEIQRIFIGVEVES